MDLSKFKPFDFQEGAPFLSITNNGVTFNKSVVLKLGKPEFAQLLIDEDDKQLVIKACEKNDDGSNKFYNKNRKGTALAVRWNSKDLLATIERITDWDLKHAGYRVTGKYFPEEKLVLFDLKQAKALQ